MAHETCLLEVDKCFVDTRIFWFERGVIRCLGDIDIWETKAVEYLEERFLREVEDVQAGGATRCGIMCLHFDMLPKRPSKWLREV